MLPRAYVLFVIAWAAALVPLTTGCTQPPANAFVRTDAARLAITNADVIDGTGAPMRAAQTVLVEGGRIKSIGRASTITVPAGAHVIDGRGRTLVPGLVGMHEHLFYQPGQMALPAQAEFARLYLANGVTTIRTGGTVDFRGDLRVKARIDSGELPGPKIHVTGPYLRASGAPDPEAIAREVHDQADRGATSVKAYMTLRASELKAAIDAAHARGLRITGHLCAVGYREAAALGIDNLEHGLLADTEFLAGKEPDECPPQSESIQDLSDVDIATDSRVHQLIGTLIQRGVAVTSTMAVYESLAGREADMDPRTRPVLSWWLRRVYDGEREGWSERNNKWSAVFAAALTREMQFERAFVTAGGRLMLGSDPTGWGALVAGFGNHRALELLVEAGLTPQMAIRVATANGADFLYETDRIGTIEPGKQADLVLVRGDLSRRISDVRNVEIVFKDGVAYDPAALIAATQGAIGLYDIRQFSRWPMIGIPIALICVLVGRMLSRGARRSVRVAPAPALG